MTEPYGTSTKKRDANATHERFEQGYPNPSAGAARPVALVEITIVSAVAGRITEPGSGLVLSASQIGFAAAIYIAGAVTGALFFGYLTDRYGRKRLFLITLAVYLAATTLTALAFKVTLDIDPRFAEGVETYMRQKHIPEVFSTGCFQQIHFERASSTRFRSRYQALTQAHLDRYLGNHAQHFRDDFRTHYPHGVVPFREVWNELQSWE